MTELLLLCLIGLAEIAGTSACNPQDPFQVEFLTTRQKPESKGDL
jgi:hypothetical protein